MDHALALDSGHAGRGMEANGQASTIIEELRALFNMSILDAKSF